ncbi:hypothetical protein Tco_0807740 [Tanacetum coccineum]
MAATGWGDEFLDKEATLGKVMIIDKKEDCDDDERSGGKILVLQEQFSQNQQDFLDEYLPQWDDQLAIQNQKSEIKWENRVAAKRGENHTVLHLSKNEEKDDDLPYLKFRKFKQLAAQIVTPLDGAWTEYVSGGVTLLSISSTKHKERPLRVSDQRQPNQYDMTYIRLSGAPWVVSATHPDRDN